jgi:hypothetical protein
MISPTGRSGRSAYDLAEDGASKVIIDSVEFYIDVLRNEGSMNLRRSCAWELVSLCAVPQNAQLFRGNGVSKVILNLMEKLQSENDETTRLFMIILSLALVRDTNGKISTIQLSEEVFKSVLGICVRDIVTSQTDGDQSGESSQTITTSNLHKKRKFKLKPSSTDPILTNSQQNRKIDLESKGSTPTKEDNLIDFLSLKSRSMMPCLWRLLGFDFADHSEKVTDFDLSCSLALTLASRLLVSAAQWDFTHLQISDEEGFGNMNLNAGECYDAAESSPDNPLISYQRILRDADPVFSGRGTAPQPQAYLKRICDQLTKDIACLLKDETLGRQSKDHQKNFGMHPKCNFLTARIWQAMALLEAASFRCQENQVSVRNSTNKINRCFFVSCMTYEISYSMT